ncbi:MAG: hypothetical protein ACP5JG_01600, partial [Anaerolineae bacterium]
MTLRDNALLISRLKGAPATVLLMMLIVGRPTGRDELVKLTTYSEHTVANALQQLEFLGLAQNHARYNGWALTAQVRQRVLAAPPPAGTPAAPEGQTLTLDADSPQHQGPPLPLDPHPLRDSQGREVQPLPLDPGLPENEGQSGHLPASAETPEASAPAGERQNLPLAGTHPAAVPAQVRNFHLETEPARSEAQSLHLDADPVPEDQGAEVQSLPLDHDPAPQDRGREVQPLPLPAPAHSDEASQPATEVQNLHLDTDPARSEVQSLPLDPGLPQNEGQNLRLASSSSCSYNHHVSNPLNTHQETTTTTTTTQHQTRAGPDAALDPAAQAAVDLLH